MNADLRKWRDLYRTTLLDGVMPFWRRHAFGPGGEFYTCLDDSGGLVSRDRWSWSQWRAVWMFSALHRRADPDPHWLEAAGNIYRFLRKVGRTEGGHWPLVCDDSGRVLRGYDSVYVDGFAIYGLVEYWRATGDRAALDLAAETFQAVETALSSDRPPPAYPYPIPTGLRPHGIRMLFSLAYHDLAAAGGDPAVRRAALRLQNEVMRQFLRDDGFVHEWLTDAGIPPDSPEGRAVVPGHAIESMWFQIDIARRERNPELIRQACSTILTHLERGWDPEFGGILLAIDAEGRQPVGWTHADTKLWWPHTEALVATLYAYEETRDARFLGWHERVRDYAFRTYPNPKDGEWFQKMDRRGRRIAETLVLPVKDPFHLPRSLIHCVETLDRLLR